MFTSSSLVYNKIHVFLLDDNNFDYDDIVFGFVLDNAYEFYDNNIFNWHLGHRFGETFHPGPILNILSVNIIFLLLNFHLLLHYNIFLIQETRLTIFGQTHLY